LRHTDVLSLDAFIDDDKTCDAVERNLEIIGEAQAHPSRGALPPFLHSIVQDRWPAWHWGSRISRAGRGRPMEHRPEPRARTARRRSTGSAPGEPL